MTNYLPQGYNDVTPYLIVHDGAAAINFYKQAFGATEVMRIAPPGGKIGHAELQLGKSRIMLADECPESGFRGARSIGDTAVTILIYVPDCDSVIKKALSLGATIVKPLADQFYGDRSGTVSDPFGHQWTVATHKEDVSPEEIQRRAAALFGGGPKPA